MSRKLEEKQARRAAEERRKAQQRREARRRNLVTIGIAAVVLGLVVWLIMAERSPSGSGPIGVAMSRAGCTDIETHEDEGRDHVDPGTPVPYRSSPPTSGPHYGITADGGFYSSAVQPGQLVHNLEHGHIVIWYRPDAPQEVIDGIERYMDETRQDLYVIATPYEALEGDYNYALSAWTKSRSCTRLSGAAIDDFRRRFQGRGPEQAGTPLFE